MNGLIRASLKNPYAVTVFVFTLVVIGALTLSRIPVDILPVFKSPAVQVLTFYSGMAAANVERDITNRMERWTGQAAGTKRQESRSIVGASVITNYYRSGTDPNGALTQVNSLATAAIPNLPPGTLPPVVLPYDPTSVVPACIVALDSKEESEAILYDVGRYEVRNMIMSSPGAVAPVVYGGKLRTVLAYLDRIKLEARGLSLLDAMRAMDESNLFLPTGDAKLGDTDFAIDSNSMFKSVDHMGDIPLRNAHGNAAYLRDVGTPKDAALIQTNVVRVNGRRQVYVPVYRQLGSSTLEVVDNLKQAVPKMKARLSRPDVDLKLVMDQSVYVRQSIKSLAQEGVLGAVLCSLVILLFLGQWRMTAIAIMTIPISVLAAMIGLYLTGNTVNVMTLAGLSLAIGPMVDSAIVCLENTHRHLEMGTNVTQAAYQGAREVAMPELVASLCTPMVLAPLALMPGLGEYLFRPMALAVGFAMALAYLMSLSFVPTRCAAWLRPHEKQGPGKSREPDESRPQVNSSRWQAIKQGAALPLRLIGRAFGRWEKLIEASIAWYQRCLDRVMRHRKMTVGIAVALLLVVVGGLGSQLRREFFPEVDAGAFQLFLRAKTGTRIEITEQRVAQVEKVLHQMIGKDLQLVLSEIGVTPDWSAAYTPNAGPMDCVMKVQLNPERDHSAQRYVSMLRSKFASDLSFTDLEFAFDAGGMITGAVNEGKSTPINIRIETKDLTKARAIAEQIRAKAVQIDGVVDCRIMERLDYPQYVVEVDRAKAADLGLTQAEVMRNVVAAFNSSIQFNKKNFWIDPVSHNQYYVGVQYPESSITSVETILNVPITSPVQNRPVPLRNVISLRRGQVPAEVVHTNLQETMEVTMGVERRDLGHVASDVGRMLNQFGRSTGNNEWDLYDPDSTESKTLEGATMTISGEYSRMLDTFRDLGIGLILAWLLIYFLMVALFRSYILPLVVLFAVPIGLVGVVAMLFLTQTAVNVQSILGVIFMVGIVVSNTVLLTDFAQGIREIEKLSPTEAIKKAASIRVRPVVMTALAAFFALLPMALGLERGSEANVPLGRAVIGGLLAGMVTTLFVVPSLYSLVIRDTEVHMHERDNQIDKLTGAV
ncbi:MAG: efflux RND transporter permease subunit [Planctomycetes bacterium]|nr:efflux RND transporter permease subunit [Planctomycetota bacterium]